jgi:ABC-type nitrate/sulfonate/bicarbonate transport system substrate-binding protein
VDERPRRCPTDGGPDGVTVLKQGFNVDPLIQKQAACISTMTYNEYWQVLDAGIKPEDLVTFKYEDEGVATLEDGLYVLEDKLDDPAFKDKMVKFVRASMKGWKYAEEHPDEAADDRARKRLDRRPDRGPPEAHDGRSRQADGRLQRRARRGGLQAHRRDRCWPAAPTRSSPRNRKARSATP